MKLLTTRATFGTLAGSVAIGVAAFVAPGENVVQELGRPLHEQQSVFLIGFLMRVLLLVFGIRAITDEVRYGTITPSLLAIPGRGQFLIAKAGAAAIVGSVIAIAVAAASLTTATLLASANGVDFEIGSAGAWTLLGMVVAGAVWSAIGVGFGAIVDSQLVATVTGLVWLMALEDAVRHRLGDLAMYLPGQAGLGLAVAGSERLLLRSLAVLTVYAGTALIFGFVLLRRRDVGSAA